MDIEEQNFSPSQSKEKSSSIQRSLKEPDGKTNPISSTTNKNDSTSTKLLNLKSQSEKNKIQEIETSKHSQENEKIQKK